MIRYSCSDCFRGLCWASWLSVCSTFSLLCLELYNTNVPSLCFGSLLPLCLRWESRRGGISTEISCSYSCLLPCKTYSLPLLIFDRAVLSRQLKRPAVRTHVFANLQPYWARPGLPPFVRASSFRSTRWNMWVDSTVLGWGKNHHWRNFALCNTVVNWMQLRWVSVTAP